jgi:hypothetical protein
MIYSSKFRLLLQVNNIIGLPTVSIAMAVACPDVNIEDLWPLKDLKKALI